MFQHLKLIILITCITALNASAQFTHAYNNTDAEFKRAKEWFMKEQYGLSLPVFRQLYLQPTSQTNFPAHTQTEIKYYYLNNALILDDNTVLEDALKFAETENNNARKQMLCFQIAEYYFRQKEYTKALNFYSKAGIENFTNTEIATSQFHKAYCYFSAQQFKEAKVLFNSIRQIKTDINYVDANYYFGFISFYDKKYSDALAAFSIAETDPVYQHVVPFYIAEIYYFMGDRDKALTYGEEALSRGGAQMYAIELKQLVGHLHFDKKEYAKALPYLEFYVDKSEKVRREDLYELAFCYYSAKVWNKAIEGLKQLGGKEDSLAQNSMYLLADAYLKTNQKANARNAFLFCAGNSSNLKQKEVSAFNYGKLSYELGYLDIAIKELQNFITAYPKSAYKIETKELLISAMANTSNYKDALEMFDNLDEQSETVKRVYPCILYARAMELMNDRQIDEATDLLNKLIAAPYNSSQIQLANFWKGEIAYRNGKTDEALKYFLAYLTKPQNNGEVTVVNANYNVGYCLLKQERYKDALTYFEQVSKQPQQSSATIEQDAYLRSADCYFMNKQFSPALKIYEDIISKNFSSADYATYQKAVIAGVAGKSSDKINILRNISKQYPQSALGAEALMEIASTYLAGEEYENAIFALHEIIRNKNATVHYPQAYLKLGIANYNLNKNEDALKHFTTLSKQYPSSQEAEESIEYIRNIFVETQRPDEFVNFMKQNGRLITYSEEDSLTYRSAQLRYEAKDTAAAKTGFINYLSKFPDGKNALPANYLLAELYILSNNKQKALPYYEAVAAKAPNKFAERGAIQAARIYYFELKDIANAEKYFIQTKAIATQQENKIESMRGLLRCQYKQQKWKDAAANAKDLLNEKTIATDDKMMAQLILAKAFNDEQKLDEASNAYKQVIALGKSEFSAEAAYRLAEIAYTQNKNEEAEKLAFDCIKKYGSYDYWLVKSYILLGDIYFKQKDYFNAEATFKSVIENATNEDLKKEVQQKLNTVIEEKDKANKVN